ncbi:hypothetical protein AB0H34_03930 [Saccharopolyspora shandongensis]|uniref:hypothetical protein n=1 Tax=Saccharopolyspora shandongensis TaxID=418495 RepID=UPI0033D6A6EF
MASAPRSSWPPGEQDADLLAQARQAWADALHVSTAILAVAAAEGWSVQRRGTGLGRRGHCR